MIIFVTIIICPACHKPHTCLHAHSCAGICGSCTARTYAHEIIIVMSSHLHTPQTFTRLHTHASAHVRGDHYILTAIVLLCIPGSRAIADAGRDLCGLRASVALATGICLFAQKLWLARCSPPPPLPPPPNTSPPHPKPTARPTRTTLGMRVCVFTTCTTVRAAAPVAECSSLG